MKNQTIYVLTPDEGNMLYNEAKNIYSDKVYVGVLDSPDNWVEVPMAQYEAWLAEQEAQEEKAEEVNNE